MATSGVIFGRYNCRKWDYWGLVGGWLEARDDTKGPTALTEQPQDKGSSSPECQWWRDGRDSNLDGWFPLLLHYQNHLRRVLRASDTQTTSNSHGGTRASR